MNTQSFFQRKSRSTSQIIKCKSGKLQKLLSYLSRIVTSTFKDGARGRGGHSASPGFQGSGGLFGVSPTIFFLYLNDLPSQALSSM